MDFTGKKVVITGAAGVYGQQFVTAFAEAGAMLCLSDKRDDVLHELKRKLKLDSDTIVHRTDLGDENSIQDLISTVVRTWASPDVVVNNAGIFPFVGVLDVTAASWDEIMAINLKAPFLLMQGFGRAMIAAKVNGCFVNLGSSAGHILRTNGIPYCVSKRALDFLSQGFALELGPHGIRVNVVEPGFKLGKTTVPEAYARSVVQGIPLGRTVAEGEVPAAVLFLSSDQASYITGATLAANGGDSVTRRASPQ